VLLARRAIKALQAQMAARVLLAQMGIVDPQVPQALKETRVLQAQTAAKAPLAQMGIVEQLVLQEQMEAKGQQVLKETQVIKVLVLL
jgi:hypothetical protein